MNSAIERLLGLRVGDVMTKSVVELPAHTTMAQAAETLVRHAISGAPVVDEQGHCVGVLSSVDFVQRERPPSGDVEHQLRHDSPDAPFHIDAVAEDLVSTHMTPAVQSISAETSLVEAGRVMCAEHVHRLPVLDGRGRVVGVVSTLDLVAAMIHAIEE